MEDIKIKDRSYLYKGEKINLRGVEKEDYTEGMHKWAGDPDFNRFLSHGVRPATKTAMENLYEDLKSKENIIFAITDSRTEKTIGIIGLHHINWQTASAEYTIHIGEKAYWGTGCAKEATEYILRHAFSVLNLNKVWLGVAEPNAKAVKFYQKMGFRTEGVLRDEIFAEGRYFNSIRMGMLKKERRTT